MHMQDVARASDLIYCGADDEGYPLYTYDELDAHSSNKNFAAINRRHIKLLERINRKKQAGELLSQSANLARLRELEKIERARRHRDLDSFENQIRLLEN